nr:ribonuclease H-like domain-containing protein [Tanacetum cinerariifolium]
MEREITSRREYHYEKYSKIVLEDSWSDRNESDHEEMNESFLMAVGSQENFFLNLHLSSSWIPYDHCCDGNNNPNIRPNGKLIHNSILNGPYVRRMIAKPGDGERDDNVNETFHEQTDDELSERELKQIEADDQAIQTILLDDELTEKELKQIEADDQAIQTILLGLPEDIYAAVDSCETAQEIWLRVQQMMKGSDIGIQEKKAKLFNEWERNQVIQHAIQNPRIQNVGNQNGLIGVPGNANQNPNGNGTLVAARAEGNAPRHNGNQIWCYNYKGVDLDEIEEVNANCILMANLQQASTSGTQTDKATIYDSDGSAENDNNVISEDFSVEQSGGTVEQHPANVEETHVLYDSLYYLAIEVEKVNTVNRKLKETNAELTTELTRKIAAKFVGDFKSLAKEAEESLAKYKALELEIERLLRAVVS